MRYRRAKTSGGTYFFTVNLADRQSSLLTKEIDLLRQVMNEVKRKHPFKLDALVVLPDHLHAIWTLPQNDSDYATRWMLIESGFSRLIPRGEHLTRSRAKKGERGVWQRRYWEHVIRGPEDYKRHVEYIYYNPVKHGYVDRGADWPYSSIHRDIEKGIVDKNWGVSAQNMCKESFGEAQ